MSTDGLTDRQHQDLQVCFADKYIDIRLKYFIVRYLKHF